MKFQCFYVSATRWRFCKIITNANNLSQHEMLKGTNVHEMTLCVTFGAPQFRTHFRFLTGCSEYAMIHMLSGTHVPQTALCVTFGARHRSIPLGLLDRTLGYLDPQGHPRTPNGSAWRPFGLPTSPKDALRTSLRHARAYIQTSGRISFRRRERHAHEVARRHRAGSGDRENPRRGGANTIPGLPVMTGPPWGDPTTGRSGSAD